MVKPEIQPENARTLIEHAIAHLDHVLPAQAPLQDFVHHNTLHGFQHLPFTQALAEAEKLTGIRAYLPEAQYRQYFRQGRINEDNLHAALGAFPELAGEELVCKAGETTVLRKHIYRIAMLYDLAPVSLAELNWQTQELQALDKIQPDVPESVAKNFVETTDDVVNLSPNPLRKLWQVLCERLELMPASFHPEQLLDADLIRAEAWLQKNQETASVHAETRRLTQSNLHDFFARVGVNLSLRDVILVLTGKDILATIRPQMIRLCASLLDEGVAAWRLPERSQLGLYGAWRNLSRFDLFPFLNEFSDYSRIIADLPRDPVECISQQLGYFGISPERWQSYLERLVLEIPGWAGMVNWRQQHPNYAADKTHPQLADFLAIRLVMDRLWLNQVCREIWKIEGNASALQAYFEKNLSEFMVRRELHAGRLPEYLTHETEMLVVRAGSERECRQAWQHLADLIAIWQKKTVTDKAGGLSANNSGWRLFRLCQHLGLNGKQVEAIGKAGLLTMLNILDAFDLSTRSKLWLVAYERHYREEFLQAIQVNRERGRWAIRASRPSNQIIFCMDDREESFRRHLEELDPTIETLGAAGFFGVAMNYQGLDDTKFTALCPIIVTPAHNVQEQAKPGAGQRLTYHQRGRAFNQRLARLVHHGFRQNPIISALSNVTLVPFALAGLLTKVFLPKFQHASVTAAAKMVEVEVPTELLFSSGGDPGVATPARPKLGFSDTEQVDRVAGFLRNTGLTYGFSPLVVLMGHGSISQNNPHLAAYDCGACSGRHGGPNARLFAAMVNRPEVRRGLADRNIVIPEDTWFIGAEHNTCDENIDWFDVHEIPQAKLSQFQKLKKLLARSQQLSAHERCRRLASAPRKPDLKEALSHIQERAADFSQARPELGHATNAAAVVGRRSVTQGAFFDRRVFLISYDCTQDPDGNILEGILLAVGPVGAGINLEYYFSTVNNERFGCGTKVPHNIVGKFGVMEGTSSDLRTGLPRQMIEIHEAMRLQLLIEAKTGVLEKIYARQESLRELIAGNWLFLSVLDPDSGQIFIFESGAGFVPWQGGLREMPIFANSQACYQDQISTVSPVLIEQPELTN